ncbi:Cap-specific mRNA (nucleoside-2'-O-)-methyltransferase 1, partial [Xenotaenia resolanae]
LHICCHTVVYRYIVCRGLKPGSDAVREYMFRVNLKLNQLRNKDTDVTEVVPLNIIKDDTDFFQFMINSNESLCAVQIKALAKIHAFVIEPELSEPRQADIRKECLKLWGVSGETVNSADFIAFYLLNRGKN